MFLLCVGVFCICNFVYIELNEICFSGCLASALNQIVLKATNNSTAITEHRAGVDQELVCIDWVLNNNSIAFCSKLKSIVHLKLHEKW